MARPTYYDIGYAIPSSTCTATLNVVCTTGGFYFGAALHVVSGYADLLVFDNASDTSGIVLGMECITASVPSGARVDVVQWEHRIPIKFDKGITVGITGTAKAVVFYSPKG